MHGLADVVVAPEREREIRDTSANMRSWQVLPNPAGGSDKVGSIAVMLFHSRGYCQHIGVKDYIYRIEANFLG